MTKRLECRELSAVVRNISSTKTLIFIVIIRQQQSCFKNDEQVAMMSKRQEQTAEWLLCEFKLKIHWKGKEIPFVFFSRILFAISQKYARNRRWKYFILRNLLAIYYAAVYEISMIIGISHHVRKRPIILKSLIEIFSQLFREQELSLEFRWWEYVCKNFFWR